MSYKLHVQKLALVLQTSVEPPNWLKSNVQVDENPMLSPEIQMWNFIGVTYFFWNCFTESDLKTAHGSGFLYLESTWPRNASKCLIFWDAFICQWRHCMSLGSPSFYANINFLLSCVLSSSFLSSFLLMFIMVTLNRNVLISCHRRNHVLEQQSSIMIWSM